MTQTSSLLVFPTKVDSWLAILIGVALLGSVVALGTVLVQKGLGEGGIALAVAVAIWLLVASITWPMRYELTASDLIIRHGFMAQQIPLRAITKVEPSRNPLSSPALSLDRLQIDWMSPKPRWVLISPADQDGFLQALTERAGLQREGARLLRAS